MLRARVLRAQKEMCVLSFLERFPNGKKPMPTMDRTYKVLFSAVDQLNEELLPKQRLTKTPETVVFGHMGKLDSLALVNFLMLTEQKLEDEFNFPISLADERAMSQERSPFRTLATMADYIGQLLREKGETISSQDDESSLQVPARESAGT
jgi:acyl carrier protein